MMKTIKDIWRVFRKVAAGVVFLFAFIQSGGLIQGLNYTLDGGEFTDVGGVMIISALFTIALIIVGVIIWPGRVKQEIEQDKKPKAARTRTSPAKKTAMRVKDLSNTDDTLISALEKGDIFGDGVDADQIPGTIGEFGLDVNNPIPVKSVLGAMEYLENLTFSDGSKVKHERVGSTSSEYVKHPVDAYELSRDSGDKVCTIYLSPYHKRNSRKKPDLQTVENKPIPEAEAGITDPFEPSAEVQTVEGLRLYLSKLSKLSHEEVCVELSNVMSAKHNLMFLPTSIHEYAEKQTLVTDLTDKALWICINVFGQGPVSNFNKNNPSRLNEQINKLDEQVSQHDLKPEQHGARVLQKLGEILTPD